MENSSSGLQDSVFFDGFVKDMTSVVRESPDEDKRHSLCLKLIKLYHKHIYSKESRWGAHIVPKTAFIGTLFIMKRHPY